VLVADTLNKMVFGQTNWRWIPWFIHLIAKNFFLSFRASLQSQSNICPYIALQYNEISEFDACVRLPFNSRESQDRRR
jgi:hypothetical protein